MLKRFISSSVIAAALVTGGCKSSPPCQHDGKALPAANAGCLLINQNTLLAIQHHNDRWSVPGGTSAWREAAQCTAQRETWEETGLEVKVGKLVKVFDNGFHLFLCQTEASSGAADESSAAINDTIEVKNTQWLETDSFQNHQWRYPEQVEILKALIIEHTEVIEHTD